LLDIHQKSELYLHSKRLLSKYKQRVYFSEIIGTGITGYTAMSVTCMGHFQCRRHTAELSGSTLAHGNICDKSNV